MRIYCRFGEGPRRLHAPPEDWEDTLAVLDMDELSDVPEPLRPPEALHMGEARYCRVVVEADRVCGRIHAPSQTKRPSCDLLLVWWQGSLLAADRSGWTAACAERLLNARNKAADTSDGFLAELLTALLAEEPGHIQQMEDRLSVLEQRVLGEETDDFIARMSDLRKEIRRCGRYYAQLGEFAVTLKEEAGERFAPGSMRRLEAFLQRARNLREETQLLREYASQISGAYQAQVDIAQNRIMKLLTVVTTLFLPLSLIAAWYGMNFQHMPELSWAYGYPAVIGLSALVVALCLAFFKKRHFW